MNRWTKEADELWNQFCDNVRKQFEHEDVDSNEVLDDMRRHIEAEFDARQLTVITAEDLRKVLNNLDLPKSTVSESSFSPSAPKSAAAQKSKASYQMLLTAAGSFYIIVFGVLLPLAAMIFELLTRICTNIFFDPLPSLWHAILFSLIPAFNLIGYLAVRFNKTNYVRWLGFLNAVAVGIASFYTIWFVPILPFAGIGLIAMGIGACGLAPLLSLLACFGVRGRLRLMANEVNLQRTPYLWPGLAVGNGLLLLLMVPILTTIIGLNMANSSDPETELRGIRLLRVFPNQSYLLKRCYDIRSMDLYGMDITGTNDISAEKMRGIYYRVTGKSFNTQRPANSILNRDAAWIDDWDWDFEQGGDIVGGQLKNLSLISSQMDANLQGDGAVGYLEWIMVFQNDHKWTEREARFQVQLPPGGVVSRLTLWIDGQECEAAFGGRSQTKQAYKSVVTRRRDPVLVTTKGPDQILVQCFPILPNGGTMKVRLGISFPLDLLCKEDALLQLPYINERNFGIQESLKHQLWVEADGELTAGLNLTKEHLADKARYTLRGPLTNAQLEQQLAAVHIKRNSEVSQVWAQNDTSGVSVLQTLHNQKGAALVHKTIIVLDTSESMRSCLNEIRSVFSSFNSDSPVQIVSGDDMPQTFEGSAWPSWSSSQFKGGKDNMPALVCAWDLAAESDNAAIVWIHAAQPHLFMGAEGLIQRWNRRPNGPKLLHLQVAPGPNMIIEALDGISQVQAVSRSANLGADLERLFGQLRGLLPTYHFVREVLTDTPDAAMKQASSHIVRLWAKEQVDGLRVQRGKENQALDLAVKHQLVTAVSGAVVLESKAQYDQHNLEPADPETVPTIPEPATIILMGLGALAIVRMRKNLHPTRLRLIRCPKN